MSIKNIVIAQYQKRVNNAANSAGNLAMPKEGWIRTVRKALGMSGAQLARRLGVTRAAISNTEKAELVGGVTLKNMQQMAEGLGCRFVYAIVPEKQLEDILDAQARKKALDIVNRTNKHMALESQSLSSEQIEYEIKRLQQDYLKEHFTDLWND